MPAERAFRAARSARLRDHFADTVLANLSRNHPATANDHWNVIATSCYAAADAMMKERLRRARDRRGAK